MSESLKKYLGWAGIFALVFVGYSCFKYSSAFERSINSPRSFSASGEGKVVVVPDIAQFSFSVISEGGMDVASLQSKTNEKINTIIDFLKESGVDSKDIKTESYSVSPRYKNTYYSSYYEGERMPPEIVGYTISGGVSVKVRDFSKTGDILSDIVEKGANNVSSLSFTIDDLEKVKNEAREIAIKQAKDKAKSMAKSAGFSLGKIISIDESSYPYYGKAYGIGGGDMEAMTSSVAPAPRIEAGSEEITVSVYVRYEIR